MIVLRLNCRVYMCAYDCIRMCSGMSLSALVRLLDPMQLTKVGSSGRAAGLLAGHARAGGSSHHQISASHPNYVYTSLQAYMLLLISLWLAAYQLV